jgi:hypothetical protein
MIEWESNWRDDFVDYRARGPNSNTIAHSLALVGGFVVKGPPGAIGW